MIELQLGLKNERVPIYAARSGFPDVVRLGSGELFKFVGRCAPISSGKKAAFYMPASVEDFPYLHMEEHACKQKSYGKLLKMPLKSDGD